MKVIKNVHKKAHKVRVQDTPHPETLYHYGQSLDKALAMYEDFLMQPYNHSSYVPIVNFKIEKLIRFCIGMLKTDLSKQRNENPDTYLHQVENLNYFKLKTSRGQIGRMARYMFSEKYVAKDSKRYNSALKVVDKHIKEAMEMGFIIKKQGIGTGIRKRGIELWINKDWLSTSISISVTGASSDYALPLELPNSPENSTNLNTDLSDLPSAGYQPVIEEKSSEGVASPHKKISKKEFNSKEKANVENHIHSVSSPKGEREKKIGQEAGKSRVFVEKPNPDPEILLKDIPIFLRHYLPTLRDKKERYESLNLRGTQMQRYAQKLWIVFQNSALRIGNYQLSVAEAEAGVLQMEELLFHTMYSLAKPLSAHEGYLKMMFCIALLCGNIEMNIKQHAEDPKKYPKKDYFKYKMFRYLSTERDFCGKFVMEKMCFRYMIDAVFVNRQKSLIKKGGVGINKHNLAMDRGYSLVQGFIADYDQNVLDFDGKFDFRKRVETMKKHHNRLEKFLGKTDILSENDRELLRSYYKIGTSLYRNKMTQ